MDEGVVQWMGLLVILTTNIFFENKKMFYFSGSNASFFILKTIYTDVDV